MKKILIAIGILCLAVIVVVACTGLGGRNEGEIVTVTPTPEATPTDPPAETEETGETAGTDAEQPAAGVDYEAIYALHEPDEVVMTVGGKDVRWKDHYYLLYSQAAEMEQQFLMYQYYGYALGWNSQADDEGHTYAELLPEAVENTLCQLSAIESLAEETGIALSPEQEAELQDMHQKNIAYYCGETATEEDFFAYLDTMHLSPELYWRLSRANELYEACFLQIYGENGELLDEEEALAQLEADGVVSADHILIATLDLDTREALDEATVAEKTALAQQIAEELLAIEDPEARLARFAELKEQYNEDPGAVEGYVFGEGVMVQEFYDGTLALEPGEVSAPIKSAYGYHIILRRPVDLDMSVTGGSGTTGRLTAALSLFNARLDARMDEAKASVAPVGDFQVPNILDFYTKPEPVDK